MKKYRIGIEITEKKLHLAVVAKQRNCWRIMETAAYELTEENLQHILQNARSRIPRSIKQTIISLPYNQVLMKEIHVDVTLTTNEVYQYLQQQAPVLFGKSADHWFLDFERGVADRAVAVPRENIAGWLAIYRACGFEIQAVDVDVLALARLMPTLGDYQPDHAQALLWLKATELMFIAIKSGQLIYVKTMAYSPAQPFKEILLPLLQFFNGLYPQYILANILLLNENISPLMENLSIKTASLNSEIWQTPAIIQTDQFCSLGLAIYDY